METDRTTVTAIRGIIHWTANPPAVAASALRDITKEVKSSVTTSGAKRNPTVSLFPSE